MLLNAHRRRRGIAVIRIDDRRYFKQWPVHTENETNLPIRYLCG